MFHRTSSGTGLFKKPQDEIIVIVEQLGKEKGYDFVYDLLRSGAVSGIPR
jgi:hypothetical protein